jgi:hypothetical protein
MNSASAIAPLAVVVALIATLRSEWSFHPVISTNLIVFGIVIPVFAFCFFALAFHTAYPLIQRSKEHQLNAQGRLIAEICMARSATFMTAGMLVLLPAIPKAIDMLFGLHKNVDYIYEIVACWFIVVFLHEFSIYLLLKVRPPYVNMSVFVVMCLLCVMSYANALGFLAITAASDIICGLEFSTYSLTVIDDQEAIRSFEIWHNLVDFGFHMAILMLLTRAIWSFDVDVATAFICCYLYVRLMMPEEDIYFHAPPATNQAHVLQLDASKFVAIQYDGGPFVIQIESKQEVALEPVKQDEAVKQDEKNKPSAADAMVDEWMKEVGKPVKPS